jgi:NAD-dependent dihydropyrimidine dehydrogenase PreA subunit
MDPASERASILVEALPYIRAFSGKTVVIKYGGSAMTDPLLRKMVATDLTLLRYVGMNPVIVHGGGKEITDLMKRLGKEPAFVNGLRVTDAETAEICPEVFEIGDDGQAHVIDENECDQSDCCSEAKDSCPTEAIKFE